MLFTKMTKYFSREDVTCQTVASSHCTAIAVSFIPLSYSVCVFKKQQKTNKKPQTPVPPVYNEILKFPTKTNEK